MNNVEEKNNLSLSIGKDSFEFHVPVHDFNDNNNIKRNDIWGNKKSTKNTNNFKTFNEFQG